MNDRYIYLQESFFEGTLTPDEEREFNNLLDDEPKLKEEFNEQQRIKNILTKLSLKNPEQEFWDKYWTRTHNVVERSIAWIFIFWVVYA